MVLQAIDCVVPCQLSDSYCKCLSGSSVENVYILLMRPIRKGVLNEKKRKKKGPDSRAHIDDYIVSVFMHYLPYFFYISSEWFILILVKCNDFDLYPDAPHGEWSNIFIKHEVYLCIGKTFFFSVLHNATARIESPICLNRIIRILLIGFMLKLPYAFYRANITKKSIYV